MYSAHLSHSCNEMLSQAPPSPIGNTVAVIRERRPKRAPCSTAVWENSLRCHSAVNASVTNPSIPQRIKHVKDFGKTVPLPRCLRLENTNSLMCLITGVINGKVRSSVTLKHQSSHPGLGWLNRCLVDAPRYLSTLFGAHHTQAECLLV